MRVSSLRTEYHIASSTPELADTGKRIMAHIVKILEGFSFIPRKELSLLEALEQEKVEIEYQCREGFCGSCQISLIDGEVSYTSEPIAFIPEGKILTCCCQPKSDVTIELPGGCKMKKVDL